MSPSRASAYVLFAGIITAGSTAATMTGDFDIVWFSIDGGGGRVTSDDGVYTLGIDFAQHDTQILAGADYTVEGGFYPGPEDSFSNVLDLDVKPGLCPNGFNCFGRGVLTVGLLGAEDVDVEAIDMTTLLISRADGIGGFVAPHSGDTGPLAVYADVGTPFQGQEAGCHELGADGFLDLSIPFTTEEVAEVLQLDEFAFGSEVEVSITGAFLDGTPFEAHDWVRVLAPCSSRGLLELGAIVRGSDEPDAWLDVAPLDDRLDGGGFGRFDRCYPLDSVVTISAAPAVRGASFRGWLIDGEFVPPDPHALDPMSLDWTITARSREILAVYGATPSQLRDR